MKLLGEGQEPDPVRLPPLEDKERREDQSWDKETCAPKKHCLADLFCCHSTEDALGKHCKKADSWVLIHETSGFGERG